jgi:outer membrane protein OmpA-like peptidoglycan-associated protein
MNSKNLVFAVFILWSIICWRWYVCGLMNACGEETSKEVVVAIPDNPVETVRSEETPEIKPIQENKPAADQVSETPSSVDKNPSQPVSAANMDKVQMEEVQDRMIIHFPYKSTTKEDNASIDTYLESLAQQLITNKEKVTITGHTDFVGEPGENYSFGLLRAQGIRDLLLKKGVPKSQIVCKSQGDRKPTSTNDTPYGRYLNRRVEIKVGK